MKNLIRLLDHLKTVDADTFDLDTYGRTSSEVLGPVDPECRTAACALGHGCDVFEEFRLLQICVEDDWGYPDLVTVLQFQMSDVTYTSRQVCDFFGINDYEAADLFGPLGRSLEQQIKYMERFIDAKSQTPA